jgi:stage III sporulation protein AE
MAILTQPAAGALADELGVGELEKSIPREAGEIYGGLTADAAAFGDALSALGGWLLQNALPVLRQALRSAAALAAILILCGALESVSGGGQDFTALGGALGVAAVAAGDLRAFIGLGEQTVQTLADFGNLLLPCLAAATAAAGGVTSGGALYAATVFFMDLLLELGARVVMPLIYVYIAAVTARAALGAPALTAAVKVTKWLSTAVLTVLVTAFTAYFSVTGAIGAAGDAASARVAKAAIAAALPVVGKIVAGAADTVAAGAALLRAGVGVLGVLAVLAVCAYPFLALGIHYLVYKAAAMLGTGLAAPRLGQLIGDLGTAFGMVLGLVGAGALMLFFALVSCMKAVTVL